MLRFFPYLRMSGMAIALPVILLAACAAPQANYPSLAVRDAERVQSSFESGAAPAQPAVEIPASADLTQRLAQLQSAAASAHRAFLSAAPSAARLVNAASGASNTNDRWASAQIALASLESARSQAAVPLGDLDLMHANAALALEQRSIIEDTRNAVTSMIAEEDAILSTLRRKMPS